MVSCSVRLIGLVLIVETVVARTRETLLVTGLTVELERGSWWACLEGDRSRWSIRGVCSGDGVHSRGLEICWPDPAAQAIAEAMRTVWDSSKD